MPYIRAEPLLTADECNAIARKVLDLEEYWEIRGADTFYTLGASTYNDSPDKYRRLSYATNLIMARHFGGLLEQVCDFFTMVKGRPVVFMPHIAVPGFHIFNHLANGVEGHIHIDEPFKHIQWPGSVSNPFTFTLPVMLPPVAGLNVYPDIDWKWFDQYDHGVPIDPPEPQYHPYFNGVMYWHSGLLAHQIANPVDLGPGEYRITLQGHGITLGNGKICLYF